MGRWVDLDKQLIQGNKASAAGILGRNCTTQNLAFRSLEGRLLMSAVVGMASKLKT